MATVADMRKTFISLHVLEILSYIYKASIGVLAHLAAARCLLTAPIWLTERSRVTQLHEDVSLHLLEPDGVLNDQIKKSCIWFAWSVGPLQMGLSA